MGQGLIAAIVSVLAALVGQARITSRPDRARARIEATVALLGTMESNEKLAGARNRVLDLIDEQVEYLAKVERKSMERRYDPSQPFISALFAVPAAYGAYRFWQFDGWWWSIAAVILGLLVVLLAWTGITGFFTPPRSRARKDPGTGD